MEKERLEDRTSQGCHNARKMSRNLSDPFLRHKLNLHIDGLVAFTQNIEIQNTAVLSEGRAKVRDWAVLPVRAGCCSRVVRDRGGVHF